MKRSDRLELAPITRHLRAMYGSRLLVAAVHHLNVFEQFRGGPRSPADLQRHLDLKDRPAMVLFPALCAMGMLERDSDGNLSLTGLGRHLTSATVPNLVSYAGLEKNDPGILEMAQRLRNDGPLRAAEGTAFVKDGTGPSPMDDPETARHLTLALAGRAGVLSPVVADALPKLEGHLLDVAGGSGLFAYEWLRANPQATATVFDCPEVLAVAGEFLDDFCVSGKSGAGSVRGRVRFQPGNMLEGELPRADLILAASLFHDWPQATCRMLARRFGEALKAGGQLWVHDAFLNDTLDGPLPVTDYSAQLFWVTKGRCYSRGEYREWFSAAGLGPTLRNIPTLMDYGLICARKPR